MNRDGATLVYRKSYRKTDPILFVFPFKNRNGAQICMVGFTSFLNGRIGSDNWSLSIKNPLNSVGHAVFFA
jgi:hypothetical protein